MIGFSLQHFTESDKLGFHIEPGYQCAVRMVGNKFWLSGSLVGSEEIMEKLETELGTRPKELEGFTLFYQPSKHGWQMSVRRKGEPGWDVRLIPDEEAQRILAMLGPIDHPDGPFKVVSRDQLMSEADSPDQSVAAVRAAGGARSELTAAVLARVAE